MPITYSFASSQDSEHTEKLLKVQSSCESRCVHIKVLADSQYYEGMEWRERTEASRRQEIYNAVRNRHVDGQLIDFPNPAVQSAVSEW